MEKSVLYARRVRFIGCGFLLALLAVCGYAGAYREEARTVSVPVVYETMTAQEIASDSMEEIRARLADERTQEAALLESVAEDPKAEKETAEMARRQKLQLAERIDAEARTLACLAYMGYDDVAVVCGAESVTVIAPFSQAESEQDRVRIIDAAAAQTGIRTEAVKIILAKK